MSLKDEILARPDCAEAVATRDLDALAALVSAGRTTTRRVPIEDIQARLMSAGEWWQIKAAATPGSIEETVIDVAGARYGNVDFSLPLVRQQFAYLVGAGRLAQSTFDDLLAMSQAPAPVSRGDVEAALFNPDGSLK